jgi:hypothetical protein
MWLLSAPKSKSFGYQEPRIYIDVEKVNNFSTYNNNGKDSSDYVRTCFNKVRLVSIKNKRGDMVDKIDMSDFTFAESNN